MTIHIFFFILNNLLILFLFIHKALFLRHSLYALGFDWRPQIIETVFLSNPVSRVEKTSDTLYIYVPTGTRYTKAIMDFISYSGKSESIDATDMVMKGKKNNLSQPIYEWDMSSNMIGSFKIEYREDK